MKIILKTIIKWFYPVSVFKNCNVKNRREKIENFNHNKKHKMLLLDCAINYFYFFSFAILALFQIERLPYLVQHFSILNTFLCGFLGTIAVVSLTIGVYMCVVFLLLSKLDIAE